jgi:hypothetical protein
MLMAYQRDPDSYHRFSCCWRCITGLSICIHSSGYDLISSGCGYRAICVAPQAGLGIICRRVCGSPSYRAHSFQHSLDTQSNYGSSSAGSLAVRCPYSTPAGSNGPVPQPFMLGFLVWGTITLIWAEDLSRGVTLLQTYALRLILFLFLIPNVIKTRHDLNGLMNTLALAGWVLVLVSMVTILNEGYIAGTRLSVLGVNENSLGILAMLTMLGVLWQAMQSSDNIGFRSNWLLRHFCC